MGLFDFFKKKRSETETLLEEKQGYQASESAFVEAADLKVNFTRSITNEESELAAVITSAILAGNEQDAQLKIKSVTGIDTDKEMASAVVAAVLANDQPDSQFRLHSIKEIK